MRALRCNSAVTHAHLRAPQLARCCTACTISAVCFYHQNSCSLSCLFSAEAAVDQENKVPNLVGTIFTAVENTDKVHNLLVCTLCSCYPLAVLGMSPPWYKSRSYRARAVRDPRGVLKEFGTELPADVAVRVHDSTADMRYVAMTL